VGREKKPAARFSFIVRTGKGGKGRAGVFSTFLLAVPTRERREEKKEERGERGGVRGGRFISSISLTVRNRGKKGERKGGEKSLIQSIPRGKHREEKREKREGGRGRIIFHFINSLFMKRL